MLKEIVMWFDVELKLWKVKKLDHLGNQLDFVAEFETRQQALNWRRYWESSIIGNKCLT